MLRTATKAREMLNLVLKDAILERERKRIKVKHWNPETKAW
jgi:hypothetical protein